MTPARLLAVVLAMAGTGSALAHDGPPFPIVSDQSVGPYRVSVWTDPDVTDDASALGGQFWVIVQGVEGAAVPAATTVFLEASSLEKPGDIYRAGAVRDARAPSRYFGALRMDREGPWAVSTAIEGPLGRGAVSAQVEATYELRPAPGLLAVYLLPFLLVGFVWVKALRRGRRASPGA